MAGGLDRREGTCVDRLVSWHVAWLDGWLNEEMIEGSWGGKLGGRMFDSVWVIRAVGAPENVPLPTATPSLCLLLPRQICSCPFTAQHAFLIAHY